MSSLALEVFIVRVLAYTVQTFLVYLVLGIAMTGFGAASSLVAMRRDWLERERVPVAIAAWAVAYPASLIVAYALFARLAPVIDAAVGITTFLVSALLTLPFIAAGAVVTLVLASAGPRLGRAYAADLIGAGIGCFVPLLVLGPIGGERFLVLLALLGWVGAFGFVRKLGSAPARLGQALWGTLALVLVALAFAPWVVHLEPEPYGQVGLIQAYSSKLGFGVHRIYDRWNMTGRVEVYAFDHVPGSPDPYAFHFYAQDNTAGAIMARWDGRDETQALPGDTASAVPAMCDESLFAGGYTAPRADVLVIGVGGGADVQCALYHRAHHVDAVEINPASIAMIRGPFNDWLGGIGSNPRVSWHLRDGRSFAHGARPGTYDLVQLSGVDTKSVLSSGALALSENHLYTREAFRDYLASLKPDGVLSIVRFGEPEALRLAATAVVALRDLGISHPEQHMVVIKNYLAYDVIVQKRGDWDDRARQALYQRFWFHDRPFRGLDVVFLKPFGYRAEVRPDLVYEPTDDRDPVFRRFFAQVRDGTLERFAAAYPANIVPASDDRPFFFDTTRYDLPSAMTAPHVPVLIDMLISVLLLAAALVLAPVWITRQRIRGAQGVIAPIYFAAVGLAYLFLEIWYLQRFAMFLGHQIYALGVVLATLLLATGAGAALGARTGAPPRRRILLGVAAILIVVALWFVLLPPLFARAWTASMPVKVLCAIAFVAPAGLAMGLPFPAGLDWVGRKAPGSVAWCVGINFFASVVATVAAVPMSLLGGYHVVLIAGVALYVLAALSSFAFGAGGALAE